MATHAVVHAFSAQNPRRELLDARRHRAGIRRDHPQPLLHHPVVHARCGRDRDQEAFIHRRPAHGADVALDPEGDVDDPIGLGQRAYDDLGAYFAELIPQRIAGMLGA